MPKISKRRRQGAQDEEQRKPAVLSQAHKVSFEGSTDENSNGRKTPPTSPLPRTMPCQNMKFLLLSSSSSEQSSSSSSSSSSSPQSVAAMMEEPTEEACLLSSPWGQFVDVIPEDDDTSYFPRHDDVDHSSPHYHKSPSYHPYMFRVGGREQRHHRHERTPLPEIPNKDSVTRKLQRRHLVSPSTKDVQGALEQLRFE